MSVDVFGLADQGWRARAIDDIQIANLVVLVTYMYDASDFHKAFLARLNGEGQ